MAFQFNSKLLLILLVLALIASLYVAIKSKCSCASCAAPSVKKEGFDMGANSVIEDDSTQHTSNIQYFG